MARKPITNRDELRQERLRLKAELNYQRAVIDHGVEHIGRILRPIGMVGTAVATIVPLIRNPIASIGTRLALNALGSVLGRTTAQSITGKVPNAAPSAKTWIGSAITGLVGTAVSNGLPKLIGKMLKK